MCVLLQVQFGIIFALSFYAYYRADELNCSYPQGLLLANVIYQCTLLMLFSHFFVKTYLLPSGRPKKTSTSQAVANGEPIKLKEN